MSQSSHTTITAKEAVMKAFQCLMPNPFDIGLHTGLRDLDELTKGLNKGEFTVIAARPGMGKSSLLMNIVEHCACDLKKRTAVYSLTMDTSTLTQRLLCSRAGVSRTQIREGFVNKKGYVNLTRATTEIANSELFFDNTTPLTIEDLCVKARTLHREQPLSLIAVDGMQCLRSTAERARESSQHEMTEVSAGLKALARELDIPVIATAPLNRRADSRIDNYPLMSDIRGSGSIEEDADTILLLMRPAYYALDAQRRDELAGQALLIIAKHRHITNCEIALTFIADVTRFRDRARYDEDL